MPRVAVVVDTSGSMGEDDLAAALAEISGVLKEVGVGRERVAALSCDADAHTVHRVTSADQVELLGGGGTDMRVGLTAALHAPQRPRWSSCSPTGTRRGRPNRRRPGWSRR